MLRIHTLLKMSASGLGLGAAVPVPLNVPSITVSNLHYLFSYFNHVTTITLKPARARLALLHP